MWLENNQCLCINSLKHLSEWQESGFLLVWAVWFGGMDMTFRAGPSTLSCSAFSTARGQLAGTVKTIIAETENSYSRLVLLIVSSDRKASQPHRPT